MRTIEMIKEVTNFLNSIEIKDGYSIADYCNINKDFIKELKGQSDIYDFLRELLQDKQAFDEEVIYYGSAMQYLSENDPYLRDSLEIANEYGFTFDNLNSGILASLLATRKNEEDFTEKEIEINEFFEELFK